MGKSHYSVVDATGAGRGGGRGRRHSSASGFWVISINSLNDPLAFKVTPGSCGAGDPELSRLDYTRVEHHQPKAVAGASGA